MQLERNFKVSFNKLFALLSIVNYVYNKILAKWIKGGIDLRSPAFRSRLKHIKTNTQKKVLLLLFKKKINNPQVKNIATSTSFVLNI